MTIHLFYHYLTNSTTYLLGEYLLEDQWPWWSWWQFCGIVQGIFHIICWEWTEDEDRGGHWCMGKSTWRWTSGPGPPQLGDQRIWGKVLWDYHGILSPYVSLFLFAIALDTSKLLCLNTARPQPGDQTIWVEMKDCKKRKYVYLPANLDAKNPQGQWVWWPKYCWMYYESNGFYTWS